jgi:two-component system, OmpR family, sensor histidine kinase CreC
VKIRTAIFGVYVAASAVGFAVLMGFILHEVRPRYVESMRRTLSDTASLLAAMLETDQAKPGDLAAAWRANSTALANASGSLRVYVTDAHAVVVFDSAGGRDLGRDYTRRPEMSSYFAATDYPAENASVADGELRVTAPVRAQGAIVGFVGVARPLSSVADAVLRARLRLAAGGLVIAAIMLAAGWWISARLTHSLERLTVYVQAMRDGRSATPPVSRAAEIAALARAFEEMRVALEGKAYVERYTQTLAHEIKAPLSAIRGAAELLEENLPPAERAKFLANLRAESARIQQIVDRLLQLATLEARHGRLELAAVDLRTVAQEVFAGALGTAAARRIALVFPEGPTVRVRGEKFLLAQAVTNLLQNALEFTPAGGGVTLFVGAEDSRAVVTVDDSGPGIPGYALPRLFERFYSLPRPDTGRKSTGLGLSIVREVALLHGGEVKVANRPEGGARAELRLPLA